MSNDENSEEPDDDFTKEEEEFIKETETHFEKVWKEGKNDAKELSKKELAKQMFVLGVLMYRQFVDEEMEESVQFMKEHPDEIEKMIKEKASGEDDSFWSEGAFIESVSPEESKEREKTIHLKHDEDVNYNCKKCDAKISAHNRDWHAGMCDNCFNKTYFQEK